MEEFTREFEILWLDYNECKFNQDNILKKMGIYETNDNKNEKTQQASWRNIEEIGSNETIRRFPDPPMSSDLRPNKDRKVSVERKLVKGNYKHF